MILGVAILCVYVYLNLATFFLGPLLESLWIRKEESMERRRDAHVSRAVAGNLVAGR